MDVRTLPFLMLLIAGLGSTANAKPTLGIQKFFHGWAVACDNRLACEAIALQPELAPFDGISLLLTRAAMTGDIAITLSGFETKSDRYRVIIDGRIADTGAINADAAGPITVTGPDALRLARSLAKGRTLTLRDGEGAEIGKISLRGSAAAFGHIDKIQNRAATKTALTAPGARNLVVNWMPSPVITAKKIVPTETTPDATTLVSLIEGSPCKEERYGVTEDTAYSLGRVGGKARALVMISCGSGAYNFASAAFIGTEEAAGKWRFAPAEFDYGEAIRTMDNSVQLLVNADWDAATQTMSSFAKSRGPGDCGNAESYVWDGAQFRLISAYAMDQCRGSLDWLALWHADVKLVD
jgi:Protein of unknown function (DUF1176)